MRLFFKKGKIHILALSIILLIKWKENLSFSWISKGRNQILRKSRRNMPLSEMKSNLLILLFVLSTLLSCTTTQSEKAEGDFSYQLVKVDSFAIENQTQLVIVDFSPVENIFLGYSIISDEILEIDPQGTILKRVHKKGEGPGLYGNWNPTGMSFGPDSTRILEFPFSIVTFSPEYELINQTRISSPLPIRTFGPMGKPPVFQKEDSTIVLAGPSSFLPAHYLIHNQEGKDTLQNFYAINLVSGKQQSVIPYLPESVYQKTDMVYYELMTKRFVVDQEENELILVHGLDPFLLIYDLSRLELKRKIDFTPEEFLTFSPLPIGTPNSNPEYDQHRFYSGRNQRLVELENQTYLLQYFQGISESEYLSKSAQIEGYTPAEDQEKRSVILFVDRKALSKELPSPKGNLILGLPGNKILVQEPGNPEIEEEIFRFSIYELVKN